MAEANNALKIRLNGFSLLQTQDDVVISDYDDRGEVLEYPSLYNEQANYISTELKKRLSAAVIGLVEELAQYKASLDPAPNSPLSTGKPPGK